jgi:hypothetical protein
MKAFEPVLFGAIFFALIFGAMPVKAGSVEDQTNENVVWQAGVDGIEVEWNNDGSVRRISSKFSTPVEFGDRRGISKAQIIAEEKAKAAIVRFLNQDVASGRIIGEVQYDLNRAIQNRESGEKPKVKKLDDRTMVEALTEVTTSFASGHLKGVIVLEKGYSDKTDEAWVIVGISEKTIKAARRITEMGREQHDDSGGSDNLGKQPSETRRTQRDW